MVYVQLAQSWTDRRGLAHTAGAMVDVDAITLAQLEQHGVVAAAAEFTRSAPGRRNAKVDVGGYLDAAHFDPAYLDPAYLDTAYLDTAYFDAAYLDAWPGPTGPDPTKPDDDKTVPPNDPPHRDTGTRRRRSRPARADDPDAASRVP